MVIVLADKPLWQAMSNPKTARRTTLWAIELSEFDIQYHPRTVIEGQVVVDFIAEFINVEGQGAEEVLQWSIHTDRSSNKQAGGAGVILYSLEGDRIECMVRLDFPTTNNEVEYEALIAGLDLARATRAENLVIYYDSQVVTSQVNGDYECRNEWMKKYLEHRKDRVNNLQVKFVQIPREENEHADRLAKAASAEHLVILSQVLSFV